MIINTQGICKDLLMIQLQDGIIDLSWELDTDKLRNLLLAAGFTKILDLKKNIDFEIQIDNIDTFDSINLKQYNFSEIDQVYKGNIVYSAVIPFNKNKFDTTNYFFRVRIKSELKEYSLYTINGEIKEDLQFNDLWSESFRFQIQKNYTKDIVEVMYTMVADFNAYNKEVKSANFYYLFQAFADSLNKEFYYILDEKNNKFLNKSLPDRLQETFGVLFNFTNIYGLSMEEYRRILKHLIIGYQHGGAWNYIKNVLRYIIGYEPELFTLKKFYPWILRKAIITGYDTDGNPVYQWDRPDPVNFSDRNYYNPESNYYLFKYNYPNSKNKNECILIDNKERQFTFIVKTDNFFNNYIDSDKIKEILNILKSTYTKYSLNIEDYKEPIDIDNILLVNDNDALLINDSIVCQY